MPLINNRIIRSLEHLISYLTDNKRLIQTRIESFECNISEIKQQSIADEGKEQLLMEITSEINNLLEEKGDLDERIETARRELLTYVRAQEENSSY